MSSFLDYVEEKEVVKSDPVKKISPLTSYMRWFENGRGEVPEEAESLYIGTMFNTMEDDGRTALLLNNIVNKDKFTAFNIPTDVMGKLHRKVSLKKSLTFTSSKKLDLKIIKEIREKLPHLKLSDIETMLNICDDRDALLESLNLKDSKKQKVIKTFDLLEDIITYKNNLIYDTNENIDNINKMFVCYKEDYNNYFDEEYKLLNNAIFYTIENKTNKNINEIFLDTFEDIDKIISFLNNKVVVCPVNAIMFKRFLTLDDYNKCDKSFYKYNNNAVLPILSFKDTNRLEEIDSYIDGDIKKRISKQNIFLSSDLKKSFIGGDSIITSEIKINDVNTNDESLMLVSSVHESENKRVALMFRNEDKKIIKYVDDTYTFYTGNSRRYIENIDLLNPRKISYSERYFEKKKHPYTFGLDYDVCITKSLDWKKNNKESFYELRKCYFDIEIYTNNNSPNFGDLNNEAKRFPINLITIYDNYINKYETFVFNMFSSEIDINLINENLDYKEEVDLHIYNTEEEMLNAFFDKISEEDADVYTGWNSDNFDWVYIVERCKHLGITPRNKYGMISISESNSYNKESKSINDKKSININIPYSATLDYLKLYKTFSFGKKPSYKLNAISEEELGIKKLTLDENMDNVFKENINKFIAYNINDVHLVRLIDDKVMFLNLAFNITNISNINWNGIFSKMKMLDGFFITYLYDKNKVMRTGDNNNVKQKLEGAFVRMPIKGIYEWSCDLDATQLYPSIFARFNLSIDTYIGIIDERVAYEFIYKREEFLKGSDINLEGKFSNKDFSRKDFEKFIIENKYIITICGTIFKSHEEEKSLLFDIATILGNERKNAKNKMFDNKDNPSLYARYNNEQMTYKVIMNSIYGAMCNEYFRFFNFNIAKTITSTGRELVKLAACQSNVYLNKMIELNKFEIEPIDLITSFLDMDGDILEHVIYGDSVTGDTKVNVDNQDVKIKDLFECSTPGIFLDKDKEINPVSGYIKTYDGEKEIESVFNNVMRHKTDKDLFEIETESGKIVTVTEDHSVMVERDGVLVVVKPMDILDTDLFICLSK